jgi:glycosyltransferase involved in cell wall biosynthesis
MIDVILPVLNEEGAIPWVLERMPRGYRPIVVDNGSTDSSVALARELCAEVITERLRGFGAACFAGLMASNADVVCFMDCDGSLDPRQLPLVTGPVTESRFDLVLGRRVPERGAWPLHARVGNELMMSKVRRATALSLRDLGPMRAAQRGPLMDLGIRDRRFGWPLEMVMLAARAGWRIEEVDVAYRPRVGRSKVTGTLGGTLRAARDMAKLLA